MGMKKRLLRIGLVVGFVVVVAGGAWLAYRTFPRSIDETLTGVKYQLGAEGAKMGTEPATVVIRGKLHTSLTGKRTFKGEVTVVGEQIPVPEDQRKIQILFASDGWGAMSYPYFYFDKRGVIVGSDIYHSHSIFASKDFSQVTLLLNPWNGTEQTEGWSTDDGAMISAPASAREDALTLSNRLMREFLAPLGKPLQ